MMPPDCGAQGPPVPPPAAQPATTQDLKLIILSGNHDMNDLANKVMAILAVQVVDQSDRPVGGADVTFRFPLDGPSGTFPNQKNSQTFRSNVDGQAMATGWTANGKVGTFEVQVTASRGSELGSATISVTNVTRIIGGNQGTGKRWWNSKWGKIGIAAAAAGIIAGIVLAVTHSSSPTVITATPGSPTIGAPQ